MQGNNNEPSSMNVEFDVVQIARHIWSGRWILIGSVLLGIFSAVVLGFVRFDGVRVEVAFAFAGDQFEFGRDFIELNEALARQDAGAENLTSIAQLANTVTDGGSLAITPMNVVSAFVDSFTAPDVVGPAMLNSGVVNAKDFGSSEAALNAASGFAGRMSVSYPEAQAAVESAVWRVVFEIDAGSAAVFDFVSTAEALAAKRALANVTSTIERFSDVRNSQSIMMRARLNERLTVAISEQRQFVERNLPILRDHEAVARRLNIQYPSELVAEASLALPYLRGYLALENEIRLLEKQMVEGFSSPASDRIVLEIQELERVNEAQLIGEALAASPLAGEASSLIQYIDSGISLTPRWSIQLFAALGGLLGVFMGLVVVAIRAALPSHKEIPSTLPRTPS